jgi:hypothetical protein
LGRLSLLFNLKCVHILRNKVKDTYEAVSVYEMVELRIYKNDFKSTTIPQIEVLVDLLYKATKIIIDLHPTSKRLVKKWLNRDRNYNYK